jgi:hypothetical protein
MRTILTTSIMILSLVSSGLLSIAAAKPALVLQLQGKAVGATRNIPPIETTGTREGNCFEVDMIDVMREKRVGTAVRCFTDIQTRQNGMALTETTFLQFPEGTIVARTHPTFQPLLNGASDNMTHITGTVPAPLSTNLLPDAGTAQFKGVPGHIRLGGVADLRNFQAKNEIAFNSIAIVEFADSTDQVKQAQRRLREAGFYTGSIDGVLGPNTAEALRRYQAKHGLPETGELDTATQKALEVH